MALVNEQGRNKVAEAVGAVNEAAKKAASRTVEQANETLEASAEQAMAGVEATQARAKEGMDRALKTTEELFSFGQGNMEAFAQAGRIWAAGVQDLSRQAAASTQASFQTTLTGLRALGGARSFQHAIELQANLARSAMESTVAESGRLTEASMKLAEQAIAPLTARFSVAVEKFARTA